MYPVLFQIGPISLYGYGLMMFLAFWLGTSWAARRALRYGFKADDIYNLSWVYIVGGILGGRATYFIVEESISDLFSFHFFEFWKGGMVYYGGFIVAVLSTFIYSAVKRIPFWKIGDTLAPPIALGHALGRLGCLLAGCCYGKQCDLPWAITFENPMGLAPLDIALHPTQIYEFLGNMAIVCLLLLYERGRRKSGSVFAMYLVLYGLLRPTVEIFRGDLERGFFDFFGLYPNEWLSTSTLISFGLLVAASLIFIGVKKEPEERK